MTFLNAILLGGLATALIPILIHLLHRRRYQVIRWGAMDFLEELLRTQRRRIRIEEWLLLAVRAALLGLLAFAMARPVLTGRRAPAGSEPTSLLVLLDNSLSMEAGDEVRTNFAVAAGEAARLLSQLPRGSEAAVIGLAGPLPTPPELLHDTDGLARAVAAAQGGYGAPNIPQRLEEAAGLLARARHTDRELVILSDFQRTNWPARDAGARARALARLAESPLPVRRVLFQPVGGVRDNVAVRPLQIPRAVVGVHQPIRIRAPVVNHGARPQTALRARLRVNGEERGLSEISLGAHESGSVLFTQRFDKPGSYIIEVEVEADRLQADNVGRWALEVVDRLPILVISGRISPEPLRGEADYLQLALRPTAGAIGPNGAAQFRLEPVVVAEDAFQPHQLEGVRVAVLANVSRLSEAQAAALESFVHRGGGLAIWPGDRCRADWYNERWYQGGQGFLPAALGTIERTDPDTGDTPPMQVLSTRWDHPALVLFNDPRIGGLRGVQVRTWYRLELPESVEPGPARTVMARLQNGAPLFVERAWGAGRVILASIPLNADWSNLPLRSAFVPLVHEMVSWLSSTVHPPRNVQTGQSLAALLGPDQVGRPARFTLPDGAVVERPVEPSGDRGMVTLERAERPGVYVLDTPAGERIHFAVSPPPEESELISLSDEEMRALASEMGATWVRSGDEYAALDRQRRYGRELWPWALAAVLGLAFSEIGLAHRRSREVAAP